MKIRISNPTKAWKAVSALFIATTCFFSSGPVLSAMTESDRQLLKQFQDEQPEIFSRSRLVTERNRQLLEISLGDILKLVQNRSITLKSAQMAEQATMSQLILAEQPNQPQLTTKIQQAKAISTYSTNLSGEDTTLGATDPYLITTATDQTSLTATWSKKNELGMQFSTSLEKTTQQTKVYSQATEDDSLSGGDPSDDPLEAATLSIGVSVPLFQDWGDVNRSTKKRAEIAVEQSRLSTDNTEISLLESVAKTYWTLVGVRENIKSLEEAVATSELLVKESRARVDVGVLNYTDLKEAETQLASNQQNLLSAKISEQEIEDQIRVALSLENVSFGFKPADSPKIHKESFNFNELLQKCYANSITIKQINASIKSNAVDMKEAENLDRSNMDLSFQYSFSGYGASSGESLQVFDEEPLQGYVVGLSWQVPLFDKITPERIAQARITRSRLELQLQDQKSQLTINLQTILRNIRFGLEEEKNAILSKELAKDLMDKEIEKLKIGKSTGYNVSIAQQKYTNASYSEILVRVKGEQNYIALLALTGDLYDQFNLAERE